MVLFEKNYYKSIYTIFMMLSIMSYFLDIIKIYICKNSIIKRDRGFLKKTNLKNY